ncbi:glycosyltransferase family 2 protein [Phormidesmis sp. 146-12]
MMDQTNNRTRVSIGVPVYNGDNYLEAAIDSLLAQTFKDFEIIISDNASSDRTEEICRSYVAKDARIRYYRNEVNLGAAPNFNCLIDYAQGEYFKWAAHDDIHEPTYLERCVEILDRDPGVILSYSWTRYIDDRGLLCPEVYAFDGKLRLNSEKPHERFHDIACTHQECFPIFGLMRLSALRQVPLYGSYGHADGVLLARMALLGRYYEIPEYLFLSRQHAEQSCKVFAKEDSDYDYFEYAAWYDPSKTGKFTLPHWILFIEYCRSILQAPISFSEKITCFRQLKVWVNCYWTHMVRDVLGAVNYSLHSLKQGMSRHQPSQAN